MKQVIIMLALMFMVSISTEAQKKNKTPETCTFSVNMDCQSCADKITKQLAFEKGVRDLDVSLKDFTVSVTYRPDKTNKNNLAESIKKMGYEVKEIKKEEKETTDK